MLTQLFIGIGALSLTSLAGVLFLSWKDRPALMGSPTVLAFATGTFIGTTFLHLIPESFISLPGIEAGAIMLGSALFLFFLETWMGWDCNRRHHHHTEECHGHHHHPVKPLVWVNLIGDGVHNFIDGALIATAFMADVHLGWATVLAIALHEIPQELSDFLILRHGGLSVKRALLCNFLGATTAFAGAGVVVYLAGAPGMKEHLLPIGAGCFLYLSMVDLLPEVKKMVEVRREHWGRPFLALMVGVLLMGYMAMRGHAGHDHGKSGHHGGHDETHLHDHGDHEVPADHHGHSHAGHLHHSLDPTPPDELIRKIQGDSVPNSLPKDTSHDHQGHNH